MRKKDIKYYAFIIIILAITIVVEVFKPKPVDWKFSLEKKDKIPYGTFVLFNTLKDIFPEKKISVSKSTVWEFSRNHDIEKYENFIFITKSFAPDKLDTEKLLSLSGNGKNIFVAAHYFSGIFPDTLKISRKSNYSVTDTVSELNFYNKNLKRKNPYKFVKSANFVFFTSFDTINTEILAYNEDFLPVLLKIKNGQGNIFLCSVPEVFTNYAMITESNYEFAYKSLSYLPVGNTFWDEYYKPFAKQNRTFLSFFLETETLKNALYLLTFVTFLFVFFTAKRRQRIIPEIQPLQNKTKEFVKTMTNLYYKTGNHTDIARKRLVFFYNYLHKNFNVDIFEENPDIKTLEQKTGLNEKILIKLLNYKNLIDTFERFSISMLADFNKTIEDAYKILKNKK